MHEAGYRALGLPFTYVPFELRDAHDLPGATQGMRALGIRGFGVSQPFKQAVMPLLDSLDPVAAQIGAVNTIVNSGSRLVGHNTDWSGAVRALEETRSVAQARVLLLGAGGAARAIAFGLAKSRADVTLANRTRAKAASLAQETGAKVAPWDALRMGDYEIVINATTLGQDRQDNEDAAPPSCDSLRPGQLVMDIVYKPLATKLLAEARARGAEVVHGGRMLLHQAAAQFELYTGRPAPLAAMDEALRASIGG
jgi:shikimate dehydrogenase